MRIEGDHDGRSARILCVAGRGGNHGLVAEMNPIKNTDGDEKGAGEFAQLGDRSQDPHDESKK
jgi:hypothetical protein